MIKYFMSAAIDSDNINELTLPEHSSYCPRINTAQWASRNGQDQKWREIQNTQSTQEQTFTSSSKVVGFSSIQRPPLWIPRQLSFREQGGTQFRPMGGNEEGKNKRKPCTSSLHQRPSYPVRYPCSLHEWPSWRTVRLDERSRNLEVEKHAIKFSSRIKGKFSLVSA